MKAIILCCCLFCFSFTVFTQEKLQEINPILHDQSYVAAFGTLPDATTNEQVRIQTHLSYVEQLLRSVSTQNLTTSQQVNRSAILDLLHTYMLTGNFPVNKDYPGERRPCFIDADGNICAVGYLIEQTKGRQLAEEINARHQYDFLLDMHELVIEEWATEFGLTPEECAMIQPAYGTPIYNNYYLQTSYADIKTGYGISSGLIGGGNIAISIANLSGRWKYSRALSYIGLATGASQIIMGVSGIKNPITEPRITTPPVTTSFKAQNNLSYVNIALGTTTLVTSTLNLLMTKKKTDKRNTFNLYSYPGYNNSLSMGLCFTRKM